MPYHCVMKVERALNELGLAVKGARIAVLGVSYKPGVGDVRESPALKIIALLRALGAELRYHDPHVPVLADYDLESLPLADALQDADLALIVTAHPGVDHALAVRACAGGARPARCHARRGQAQHRPAVKRAAHPGAHPSSGLGSSLARTGRVRLCDGRARQLRLGSSGMRAIST